MVVRIKVSTYCSISMISVIMGGTNSVLLMRVLSLFLINIQFSGAGCVKEAGKHNINRFFSVIKTL